MTVPDPGPGFDCCVFVPCPRQPATHAIYSETQTHATVEPTRGLASIHEPQTRLFSSQDGSDHTKPGSVQVSEGRALVLEQILCGDCCRATGRRATYRAQPVRPAGLYGPTLRHHPAVAANPPGQRGMRTECRGTVRELGRKVILVACPENMSQPAICCLLRLPQYPVLTHRGWEGTARRV